VLVVSYDMTRRYSLQSKVDASAKKSDGLNEHKRPWLNLANQKVRYGRAEGRSKCRLKCERSFKNVISHGNMS
jgi:hypothetical protein